MNTSKLRPSKPRPQGWASLHVLTRVLRDPPLGKTHCLGGGIRGVVGYFDLGKIK